MGGTRFVWLLSWGKNVSNVMCNLRVVLVRFVVKTHKATSVLLRNNEVDIDITYYLLFRMMKLETKTIHQFSRQSLSFVTLLYISTYGESITQLEITTMRVVSF